jgi:hypothetical protein
MVRDPQTGKYKRVRLFVFTLGYSRKCVRWLVWRSSVLTPDIYDPALNPLYRDVLAHYGVVALPCRVRGPDRKGKVDAGVGHAQKTPLKPGRLRAPHGGGIAMPRGRSVAATIPASCSTGTPPSARRLSSIIGGDLLDDPETRPTYPTCPLNRIYAQSGLSPGAVGRIEARATRHVDEWSQAQELKEVAASHVDAVSERVRGARATTGSCPPAAGCWCPSSACGCCPQCQPQADGCSRRSHAPP